MEPHFKTSFIPKQSFMKPADTPSSNISVPRAPLSLSKLFGIIVLVLSPGLSGAAFLYHQYLGSAIEKKSALLKEQQEAFKPALIKELARQNTRIESAKEILAKHIAPSALFLLLEEVTLRSVQFTNFNFSNTNGSFELELEGLARDFESVALQADILGSNEYLRNPVVSDIEVTESGRISFVLTANVEERLLSYASQVASLQIPPSN